MKLAILVLFLSLIIIMQTKQTLQSQAEGMRPSAIASSRCLTGCWKVESYGDTPFTESPHMTLPLQSLLEVDIGPAASSAK